MMRKTWAGFAFAAVVLWILAGSSDACAQQAPKDKKTDQQTAPNGSYKHVIPSSQRHTFSSNFTKPPKDTIHRNYKQQNQRQGNIKFKDQFKGKDKTDHHSYKHPQGE